MQVWSYQKNRYKVSANCLKLTVTLSTPIEEEETKEIFDIQLQADIQLVQKQCFHSNNDLCSEIEDNN